MKLRISSRLVQALLTTCAAALTVTSSALAEVPTGYTQVEISSADELIPYVESSDYAFMLQSDISVSTHMKGANQYWGSTDLALPAKLTFTQFEKNAYDTNVLTCNSMYENLKCLSIENVNNSYIHQCYDSGSLLFNNISELVVRDNNFSEGGVMRANGNGIVTLNECDSILFENNVGRAFRLAGNINPVNSSVYIQNNGSVTFKNILPVPNVYSDAGGAVCDWKTTLHVIGNESILFSNCTVASAIVSGNAEFINNKKIVFENPGSSRINRAFYGGEVSVTDNGEVIFRELTQRGTPNYNSDGHMSFDSGAMSTSLTLSNNRYVDFNKNGLSVYSAKRGSCSGGISNNNSITMCNNVDLIFKDNYATVDSSYENGLQSNGSQAVTHGGSFCFSSNNYFCTSNNGNILFDNNFARSSASGKGTIISSALGGALYIVGSAVSELTSNTSISFTGNSVQSACYKNPTYSATNHTPKVQSLAEGGAIYCGGQSTLKIRENGDVVFLGNHTKTEISSTIAAEYTTDFSAGGGAIYANSNATVEIIGNNNVEFRGNYETLDADVYRIGSEHGTRLRSMYIDGANLLLAAGSGQKITFYDPIYYAVGEQEHDLHFNNGYTDSLGVEHKAEGDIVFSGRYAKEDLQNAMGTEWLYSEITGEYEEVSIPYSQEELTNSLTTEVLATTYLHGGTVSIEDGAIYKGQGFVLSDDSSSTLSLKSAELDQTGYDVVISGGSTLSLAGSNKIAASSLLFENGASIRMTLDAGLDSVLTVDANTSTENISLHIDGETRFVRKLIDLADPSQYDVTAWTKDNVSVEGTSFENLVWEGGALMYKPFDVAEIDLPGDMDSTPEIDEELSTGEGATIEGNGHKLTVKNMVQLVQLAMKNGTVKLEGADNNVVRITLTENGSLELAAGANLKVGDIVSMVANQSADVMVSHNIEITDAKMYGSKGKGTLSYIDNVNMATYGDYTIENMTITGSVIDVGEGTTLYLVNVDIKSSTHITDAPARVFAQSAHVELNGTNTWVDQEITAAQDTLLYMCGDTQRSITMAAGSEIVELTSSMFDSVTLTGTDLWLDMTGIAKQLESYDYIALDFQDFAREMAKAQVDVEKLKVNITMDGETYKHAYAMTDHGTTTTLYFPQFGDVPEPATSTLSLLALAALAARRRRK